MTNAASPLLNQESKEHSSISATGAHSIFMTGRKAVIYNANRACPFKLIKMYGRETDAEVRGN